MDKRIRKLGDTFLRVAGKFCENQKQPRKYGLDEKLYPSEIHLIALIGNNPQKGVTRLAEMSGITKGAISQTLKKLEDKGLVKKLPDPDSGVRIVLELTNKGKIAFYSHERMHEEIDRELISFLENQPRSKLMFIEEVFFMMEKGIDKRSET
jgi:DNA-binding MarR family transcriptional regulator